MAVLVEADAARRARSSVRRCSCRCSGARIAPVSSRFSTAASAWRGATSGSGSVCSSPTRLTAAAYFGAARSAATRSPTTSACVLWWTVIAAAASSAVIVWITHRQLSLPAHADGDGGGRRRACARRSPASCGSCARACARSPAIFGVVLLLVAAGDGRLHPRDCRPRPDWLRADRRGRGDAAADCGVAPARLRLSVPGADGARWLPDTVPSLSDGAPRSTAVPDKRPA